MGITLNLGSEANHRGQMATYASGKGVKPIITDFIQFCLVKGL